jgi:hypothetical protein
MEQIVPAYGPSLLSPCIVPRFLMVVRVTKKRPGLPWKIVLDSI